MLLFVTLPLLLQVCQSAVISEEGEIVPEISGAQAVDEVLDQVSFESDGMWSDDENEVFWDTESNSQLRQQPVSAGCPNTDTDCNKLGGQCISFNTADKHCEYRAWYPGLCGTSFCKCCIDCDKDFKGSDCARVRGFSQCKKRGDCKPWMYDDIFHQCPACGCSCCRYCPQTESCGIGYGRCVGNLDYYLSTFPYVFHDETSSCLTKETDQCSCIRKCRNDKPCDLVGGYCVRRSLGECKPGYVMFHCGCIDKRNCSCCVPVNKAGKATNFQCPATE